MSKTALNQIMCFGMIEAERQQHLMNFLSSSKNDDFERFLNKNRRKIKRIKRCNFKKLNKKLKRKKK